ncbi:MAG: PAS domain S-box protein [Calditrichales bacterium]|nr:MAG: PAS domain S-box protein [Calditrichales bacterium]
MISLKDSDEKYRLLVENVNDAIVISQNEKFIYFNEQFSKLLGYDNDELMMQSYKEVYSSWGQEILKERGRLRALGEEVPSRYETFFLRKDGREVNIEANVRIIEYQGDKATFAVIRDISERKLAEKELAENEKRYRMLFELSPTGLMLEDLNGIILDVNPAYCLSLGYTREELINSNVNILVHPDVMSQVEQNINDLKEGKVLKHYEKSLRKDKSICYMELHECKVPLSDGKEGILCIANDVTERVRAEEDRNLKQRMEGVLELAGAVCHELNQPMTVASVNSEMITKDTDNETLMRKLDVIKSEIRKMSQITRKLMHITRYETREYLNGKKILDIDKSIAEQPKK